MAELAGVDAVGLGSDFDGAVMPAELGDASALPALLRELRAVGFAEDELVKLAHANWHRVLRTAWA